jgi:biotin transport system substrate-specific component
MTALTQAVPRPRTGTAGLLFDAGLVAAGSLLVALLARISITLPFTPVPITGQTLGVLLVGTSLGWLRGWLSLALYLAEIAAGLPFAAEGRSGLEILTLATASGGYLWGFLAAALLLGWLANRGWDRTLRSSLSVMLLGSIVIYAFGIPWLAASLGIPVVDPGASPCDLATGAGCDALELGLYPFVVGDTIKLLLAAAALPVAWRFTRRRENGKPSHGRTR